MLILKSQNKDNLFIYNINSSTMNRVSVDHQKIKFWLEVEQEIFSFLLESSIFYHWHHSKECPGDRE